MRSLRMEALAVLLALTGAAWGQDGGATPAADLDALRRRVEEQDRRIEQQQKTIDRLAADQALRDANLRGECEATLQIARKMVADTNQAKQTWMENLTFGGDFRLRYQGDFADWGATADSDKKDRHRARFRLRAGLTKTWLDGQLEVGFRLASGNNNDPTTTEQTFGESSGGEQSFAKRPVWIDLAYAKYSPKEVKGLSIVGGKMKSPWLTNELFFDTDINPEGFWAEYKGFALGPVDLFAGAGYFLLDERAGTSAPAHDSTEFGVQAGAVWKISPGSSWTAVSRPPTAATTSSAACTTSSIP